MLVSEAVLVIFFSYDFVKLRYNSHRRSLGGRYFLCFSVEDAVTSNGCMFHHMLHTISKSSQ